MPFWYPEFCMSTWIVRGICTKESGDDSQFDPAGTALRNATSGVPIILLWVRTFSAKRLLALIRYADTARLPIDNNICENCIRPIALGRKNHLFVGTERAGKRAAAIQSLLGTAKFNGLDPVA